nr:hypothetical protein [Evansella caseinilytica]
MTGNTPEILAARTALRGNHNVPFYSDEEGNLIGKAFADKIRNLASKE